MQRFLNRLVPFILLGIAIIVFAFGIILFAYLFLFGAIIGFILFGMIWIRKKFFASKKQPLSKAPSRRIIDSNEWTKH